MNTTITDKTTQAAIQHLLELLNDAKERLLKACLYLQEQVQRDPEFTDKLCAAYPAITRSQVAGMLRVASGELHPYLFQASGSAAKALAKLPRIVQDHVLAANKVPVAVAANVEDSLLVSLDALTKEQCDQVFSKDGVRTVDEQRAWLRQAVLRLPKPCATQDPVSVRKDKLIINTPCEITRKQLVRYLEEMS